MQNPLVSIVVPVYNGHKYILECVSSIQDQTYANIEILLVNDGSTDGTDNILVECAAKDNRIHVFHQENSGVSKARKTGLEHAEGEFICFVDADDMLYANALQALANKIDSDVDIIMGDANGEEVFTKEKYFEYCLLSRFLPYHGRLYRKSILEKSGALDVTRKINIGEDIVGNIRVSLYAGKTVAIPDKIYVYRNNTASVTRSNKFTSDHARWIIHSVEETLRDLKREDVFQSEAWYKFRLHLLTMIVVSNSDFSYCEPWISSLLHERVPHALSANEKMVRHVRYIPLCRRLIGIQYKLWLLKKKILGSFGKQI